MPVQISIDAFTDRSMALRFNSRTADEALKRNLPAFFRAFRKHMLILVRKEMLPRIKRLTPVNTGKLAASLKIRQRSKKNTYVLWRVTSDVFYARFVVYRGSRLRFVEVVESVLRREMPPLIQRAATAAARDVNLAN